MLSAVKEQAPHRPPPANPDQKGASSFADVSARWTCHDFVTIQYLSIYAAFLSKASSDFQSERWACLIVGADRKMIRYRLQSPPDTELRGRLRKLANERRRLG